MRPQVIAEVSMLPTSEGGRAGPTPDVWFGCPMIIGDAYHDGRLLLDQAGPLEPGQAVLVPILFIVPELVRPKLSLGLMFQLWEGRVIGSGRVIEMLDDSGTESHGE